MTAPLHRVSAAAVVVNDAGEVLLIKGPQRGWEMPGGLVEQGESPAQAAVRETREESGVDIEIVRFCALFHNVATGTCNTLFLATAYFPVPEALEPVRFLNFRERIEACLQEGGQPVYVEFSA